MNRNTKLRSQAIHGFDRSRLDKNVVLSSLTNGFAIRVRRPWRAYQVTFFKATWYKALVLILLVFLAGGCGYSFLGAKGTPPGGIRRVAIPTVKNPSIYTDLTNFLTNELVRQFTMSDRLKVAAPELAEAVLEVNIRAVHIESAALARTGSASASRRVTVVAEAILRRTEDQSLLWKAGRVVSRQTYNVSEDQNIVEANLSQALDQVSRDLAEKIYNSLFEDF